MVRDQLVQVTGERRLSREQLIGRDAERVLIARRAHRLIGKLLGGHVDRRPDGGPGFGETVPVHRLGDAEVGEDDLALQVDQDVGRLHIAVHDAFVVRIRERARGLQQEPADLINGNDAGTLTQFVQRAALHESHHEVDDLVALMDFVHDDDVRMLQARGNARFLQEPVGHSGREREARIHDLDGDGPLESQITPHIHNCHTTATELARDVVRTERREPQSIKQRIRRASVRFCGVVGGHGAGTRRERSLGEPQLARAQSYGLARRLGIVPASNRVVEGSALCSLRRFLAHGDAGVLLAGPAGGMSGVAGLRN